MKLLHIAQEEMLIHLKQWSFYLTAIGMPLLFAAAGLIPQLREAAQASPINNVETVFTANETFEAATGYVDHAGVILTVPPAQAQTLQAFETEAAAAEALNADDIESYYVIASDYADSGRVTQHSLNAQLLSKSDGPLRRLLQDNLLNGLENEALASRLIEPVIFDRQGKAEPPIFSFIPADLDVRRLASAGLVIGLFTYIINVGGVLLIRALQRETRVRVLEVLITSTTPEQFIGGKILGLATLAFSQVISTLLVGMLVYQRTPVDSGPAALPVTVLLLSLPYLLFGYLAYCGLIMSVAAIWPNLPESGTLLAMTRMLALSPIIGAVFILPNADSFVSTALTIFPLTAPLLMPFRLLLTTVPLWQWGIGLLSLAAWATLTIWLSMRLFRAHTLLTGRAGSPQMLWQAIRG